MTSEIGGNIPNPSLNLMGLWQNRCYSYRRSSTYTFPRKTYLPWFRTILAQPKSLHYCTFHFSYLPLWCANLFAIITKAVELIGRIFCSKQSSQMSSLDTFVEFDVSSVEPFQLMTAGMLENNAWSLLYGFCINPCGERSH